MDLDRPHIRSGSINSTSELLICFASGLTSSSSMKFSKSILSPGRARDGSISLSTSLSRRLRNGSLKGGQASPFLANNGKKRGCGFENPEPSSPKVTCIGQVRVKTKKKVKQTRKANGEVGVHQNEERICSAHYQHQQDRNQRWVHLPVTICESLSCLFPCKSSCFSTSEREKVEKVNGSGEDGHISCGAVFTRWLVSLNDGEGGRRREIELVMGGGDEEETTEVREKMSMRSSRRHVFEDIEIKDDRIEVNGQVIEGEEEAARVSICLPPKNALLLMRCRSDPMKMETLANRFSWDGNAAPEENDEDEDEDVDEDQSQVQDEVFMVKEPNIDERISIDFDREQEILLRQEIYDLVMHMAECEEVVVKETETLVREEEEVESNMSSFEALLDQENTENSENSGPAQEKIQVQDSPICHSSPSTESDTADSEEVAIVDEDALEESQETEAEESSEENPTTAQFKSEPENEEQKTVPAISIVSETKEPENQETTIPTSERDKENPRLPECLLLMMCEPKLSMEVSKETWVCKTDFIRWLPERPPKKPTNGGTCEHEPIKKRLSTDSKPKFIAPPVAKKNSENNLQPRRSSCSLPATAAASIATMIEQKLVNSASYEPVELTRCKSEPMKTAAAKLMPESCFWKNAVGKLEPHTKATVGVGAAGVEF